MISTVVITVRPACEYDTSSLLEMPPYSRGSVILPFKEDILVAEANGKLIGAISIGHKDITYATGKITSSTSCFSDDRIVEMRRISGPWISKLFVLPEYRFQGTGKKLVQETVKFLRDKGFSEAYVGIHIKNPFREISCQVFRDVGFREIGSCICPLPNGYCHGALLERIV